MYWMGHGECVKLLTGVHCGVINFNSSRHNLFLSNFCQNVFKILTNIQELIFPTLDSEKRAPLNAV